MPTTVAIVTAVAAGYLIGSIPIANRVARRHGGDDLRTIGDCNPGFWNARGQLGANAALPIFVGDVAKGAIAALIGVVLSDAGQWWMPYIAGGAAMVGHAWPVFAGLRGGRSVLTFVGAALVCAPVPALMAIIVCGGVWAARRDFAWAARAGIVAFPLLQLLMEGPRRAAVTGALMTFVGARFGQAMVSERDVGRATPDDA